MNPSELANLMLTWEQKRLELDAIEERIKAEVLAIGQTQTVGNVRVTYSKGVGKYDYEQACQHAGMSETVLEEFAKKVIDFRKAAIDYDLPIDAFYTPGNPTASIKLLGKKEGA